MIDLLEIPNGYQREIGIWTRILVSSREEAIKIIERNLGLRHLGISMCAYKNEESYLLFLPFDFDSTDLRESWRDAKNLFNYLVDFGVTCLCTYSGRKGFHIFIKTISKVYPKEQVKNAQIFFRDINGLETLDPQPLGDVSRIMRLPFTYNINGTWCRPIAWNDGFDLDLDDISGYEEDYKERHSDNEYGNYEYKRPCIEYLIGNRDYWMKERGKYEPSEPVRITWGAMRLWRGDSIEEIIEEARGYNWQDFKEAYVRKKLEYLDGRSYSPYSCEALKQMGYCLKGINCKWKDIDEDLEDLGIVNGKEI